MKHFVVIIFCSLISFAQGQNLSASCTQTTTPDQVFYPNTTSTVGSSNCGQTQYLCGPNTIVYDTINSCCWNALVSSNCTLTINSTCPLVHLFWLKPNAVLNIGPNCSIPIWVYFEAGAIINNPFSNPINTYTCANIAFPSPDCAAGIREQTNKESVFRFYPNPSSSEINIELIGLRNKYASIKIINELGQIVYQENRNYLKGKTPIHFLPNGLYYIIIETLSGRSAEKLIVQRD